MLLARALGASRTQLVIDMLKPLAPEELARFREMVKRRRAREPVAYILGEREFYGRTFRVDRARAHPAARHRDARRRRARAHAPRLDERARARPVHRQRLRRDHPRARAARRPRCVAADKSEGAIAVACENALRLGAYNVAFVVCDLFGELRGPFDLITANPPYIASGEVEGLSPDIVKFEPRLALEGGGTGDEIVLRIVEGAPHRLEKGGVLALEVGAGQAERVDAMMRKRGFRDVERARDYARIERVVSGVWAPS